MGFAVGPFGEGSEGDFEIGGAFGALEEFVCEACSATDEEGDGFLLKGYHVLLCHWHFFVCDVLFDAAPADGEWVCGPESDCGHVEVHMLAWSVGPGTGQF